MDLRLEGSVALVSGATGGIGQAICATLLAEGAQVAALHRGAAARLESVRACARDCGAADRLLELQLDLRDAAAMDSAFEQALQRFGAVDILVNNAAVTLERPFLAVPEAEARTLADVNLWGPYRLMQLALKRMMLARRGAVVNVTSVVASYGGRGVSAYAMTKAALETLTRVLALEMAPKRVRLNAVAPGLIDTPMSRPLRHRSAVAALEHIPLGRVGQPEEVARAVAWLASDHAAGYVTGQVLTLDGGYCL